MKRFTKKQWKAMRLITPADSTRGVVKADDDGNMWEWVSAGLRVTVKPFTRFPYRNDLHRLMSIAKARRANKQAG